MWISDLERMVLVLHVLNDKLQSRHKVISTCESVKRFWSF
jgi:hypothetical protein